MRIFGLLLTTLYLIAGLVCSAQNTSTDDPGVQLQKLNQVYRYLNGAYVDTVHNEALVEGAIKQMLSQLDPHSSYISAEEMVAVKESFDGSFSGIGVEFNTLNDTIIVVNVIVGGPSEKVGLQPNDRIVEVDGKSVIGTKQVDVPKILRGPKGTKVALKIDRKGVKAPLDFVIVRDNIPINTVDAAYKIDPKTGYIKVNRFANNTYKEFLEAYEKLGDMDALVLDLRNNGGGLLDQAILLSNFFLPKGSVIVSTEGMRVPSDKVDATMNGPFTKGKVIVLTNENSASGSEIVAGAVQDWDRGLLIGRPTFGKGLVQRQFPLQDGSALRLTVARYHTPSGRVIQRPFKNGDQEEYYADFARRFDASAPQSAGDSSQVYQTLRKGRKVYGGGGVSPDVMVPMDTTGYTEYWSNLVRKGVINDFVIDYMDKNRTKLLAQYPNVAKFKESFVVTPAILDALEVMASHKGVLPNPQQYAESAPQIKSQLKALFAQKLWGVNEFYMIMNDESDEIYSKALDVLKNWDQYAKEIE